MTRLFFDEYQTNLTQRSSERVPAGERLRDVDHGRFALNQAGRMYS
jgi:hypothetical protein